MSELKRILLAEDDPRDVELTLTALGEHKLANEVVAVSDGAAVLEYLERRGPYADRPVGNPLVILLDLKLPKVNGLEVLRHIRGSEALRRIPVVVLTSSRETKDLVTCYDLGVNAYVVKPVQFPEFLDAVKNLGLFWALLNEPPPDIPETPLP